MKLKIGILIISLLCLTGCYDYNELNDLAIVSGVAIDYKDEKFSVTFEVIGTQKSGEASGETKNYTIKSSGNTITDAFIKTGNKLDKIANFDHIEIVLISEELAYHHLEEITDYLIRSTKIRNEFYSVIVKNGEASEVFDAKTNATSAASTYLVSLLENNNNSYNASYYAPFTEVLSQILTPGLDTRLSVIEIKNKKIELVGVGIFEDFKLKSILDTKEATIINLLDNFDVRSINFELSCDNNSNDKTIVSIYESDIKLNVVNNKIKISGSMQGRIKEYACSYNLRKEKTYETLEKKFTKEAEKQMKKVLEKVQSAHSNALSIGKNYYNKTRKPDYFLWTNLGLDFDLDLKINKRGLTFEVGK